VSGHLTCSRKRTNTPVSELRRDRSGGRNSPGGEIGAAAGVCPARSVTGVPPRKAAAEIKRRKSTRKRDALLRFGFGGGLGPRGELKHRRRLANRDSR
jgi:hypothetical protein